MLAGLGPTAAVVAEKRLVVAPETCARTRTRIQVPRSAAWMTYVEPTSLVMNVQFAGISTCVIELAAVQRYQW